MEEDSSRANNLIMNVRDLIDSAFGNLDGNTVNFKLIQTILYLIARQLRILERRVEVTVSVPKGVKETPSTFKVTEVKIHAGKRNSDEKDITKNVKDPIGKKRKGSIDKSGRQKSPDPTDKKSGRRSSQQVSETGVTSKKFEKGQPANSQSLEEYISMREKELRVIHQRADSHEQPDEAPKPMSSVDDVRYEKLLVVERLSERSPSRDDQTSQISVVTQREFLKLANIVDELNARLGPIGHAQFPENAQLMIELRKNASLTDAMAALQLSARLEATEKVLGRMMSIVTNVVGSTGMPAIAQKSAKQAAQAAAQIGAKAAKQGKKGKKPNQDKLLEETGDRVTIKDLRNALTKVTENTMQNAAEITAQSTKVANEAFKIVTDIENKLAASQDIGLRMDALENLVSAYADQINVLDTGLTSQVTNYQEQLTQMQHELDNGLEAMNEALANAQGGDTVAVTEINNNLMDLQMDYESIMHRQNNLHENQQALAEELINLRAQIEILKDTKSDRDEVADALCDKAGIKDLNGIVSLEQFDAVRGDLEKRIAASYDKFNNQEVVWQKAIDDLLRDLYEKADIIQVLNLKDEIERYLKALKARMDWMAGILGEPRTAAVTKKIFRDAPCLCCSSPADMDVEEPAKPPALPKARKTGAVTKDESKLKGDGDHKICYPGLPIPHPPHPRSHYCNRYCGGSHTLISSAPLKLLPSTILDELCSPISKTDEKAVVERVLCLPCQKPLTPKKTPASLRQTEKKEAVKVTVPDKELLEDLSTPPVPQNGVSIHLKDDVTKPYAELEQETKRLTGIMVQSGTPENEASKPVGLEKSVTIAHVED